MTRARFYNVFMKFINSQGGSSVVFLYCLYFGVRVSVTFHLVCVHIILVWFRLLSGHLLENSCSLDVLCILTICNFSYFEIPVLILRAAFGF